MNSAVIDNKLLSLLYISCETASFISLEFAGPLVSAFLLVSSHRTLVMTGGLLMCTGMIVTGFVNNIVLLFIGYAIGGKHLTLTLPV